MTSHRSVFAIVPVKAIDRAKTRLRLPEAERIACVEAMIRTTLRALARAESVSRVLVVTGDPAVAGLAGTYGAQVVADPGFGLNAACRAGLDAAAGAAALLVHADFLRLSSTDIDRLVADCPDDRIGLLPCKDLDGTNAVLLPAGAPFVPEYGPDSFARHRLQAGERGLVLANPALAFDIDSAEDLRRACPSRGDLVTYSPKVFLPLTQLCRDVCHYCTFAKTPKHLASPYMTIEEVVAVAAQGKAVGCKEALFTLGERPELRYAAARDWLDANGYGSTLHYVAAAAAAVIDRTGLLPHINAGCMSADELAMLRPVSASMGLMLESTSRRLLEPGQCHHGSPDKDPDLRLATIAEAGRQSIPFTTGILVGIGETREERLEALEAIAGLQARWGHIQEVIIQNFVPKPGTRMAAQPALDAAELVWTLREARRILGPAMSIQCPPNLNDGHLGELIAAGINDWGGVSPLTPDYVNPEAPWPEIESLAAITAASGKTLAPRLTIYPQYLADAGRWLDPALRRHVLDLADGEGLAREDEWMSGRTQDLPARFAVAHRRDGTSDIERLVGEVLAHGSDGLEMGRIAALFGARGRDFHAVCEAADEVRATANGDAATYVINRNINYTNICGYHCTFCAFSKGTRKHEGAEKPYLLDMAEIGRRVGEARERGASEVCLQGGIHPSFTGETYLEILRAVKAAVPDMHVHAFSPLEISHGAQTLGLPLDSYLALLRDNGLGSLPGTAAEILHDPVRQVLCADKLDTAQWLEVIATAHSVGLPTTSTIMFGHIDSYADWARHLLHLRDLQARTGGITEFVPLAFVAHEAPLYKRGQARRGPTLREAILMHAVGRLVLHPLIPNIQASWVKLGREGMHLALRSGANDMGGVLMDESITRAAGATHGQEMGVAEMADMAASLGRRLVRRTTIYGWAEQATAHPSLAEADCVS